MGWGWGEGGVGVGWFHCLAWGVGVGMGAETRLPDKGTKQIVPLMQHARMQ